MGQRTDTRQRIIRASLQSMRQKGYASTAISDIVTASGAPRGSVTFHFPGGKDEIAREVIGLRLTQILDQIDATEPGGTPAEFVTSTIDRVAKEFVASGYLEGCPATPIVLDRSAASPEVRQAGSDFFTTWRGSLASQLEARGMEPARAARIATLVVCGVEGALIVSRTERNVDAFAAIRDEIRILLA